MFEIFGLISGVLLIFLASNFQCKNRSKKALKPIPVRVRSNNRP
ncbi:hypothetical protein BC781_103539 [Sediminitomix flava]|uniref:Uncharacterized protein n=1 Tax=Sediminitomix flava TaxID=379075 RepID=A0A315ZY60_SEDFL|nr:hypothetical protein BC781_103539 [Sediminitomix flava]